MAFLFARIVRGGIPHAERLALSGRIVLTTPPGLFARMFRRG